LVSSWSVPSLTWVLVPLLGVLPVVGQHPGTVASVGSRGGILDHIDLIGPSTSFSFVVTSSGSAPLSSLSQTVSDEALASAMWALLTEDAHSTILGFLHASISTSHSASKRANILWHCSSASRLAATISTSSIGIASFADRLLLSGTATSWVA